MTTIESESVVIDYPTLKSVVEGLPEPGQLDAHPLANARFVHEYIRQHPAYGNLNLGQRLGMVMAELWRENFMPAHMAAGLKSQWNIFLVLKVGYFYPFRTKHLLPAGRPQIGLLLTNHEYIAEVIADGRMARAQELLDGGYEQFWEAICGEPVGKPWKKAAQVIAPTTVASRERTALEKFSIRLKEYQPKAAEPIAPAAAILTPTVISTAESHDPHRSSNALASYLDEVLLPRPDTIPAEWHSIIEAARSESRLIIQGPLGSGKTEVLKAIAQDLKQAGLVPVYVPISKYVAQATSMDMLHFVATLGAFGLTYRDVALQHDFELALAEAKRTDRLVLLADQVDDLFDNEWSLISDRLKEFSRFILAERSPRLLIDRASATIMRLPMLSDQSLQRLLIAQGVDSVSLAEIRMAAHRLDFQFTPAWVMLTAHAIQTGTDYHPVAIMSAWLDQVLRQSRSTGEIVAEVDKARRLLRGLAGIQANIAPRYEKTNDLVRENVRQAFRNMRLPLEEEDQGWSLIDTCVRAGLLSQSQGQWNFVEQHMERFLAAEFVLEEKAWVSYLQPRYHILMKWLAALIARQGADQQRSFFERLRGALADWSKLSVLDVADLAVEFNACPSQVAQEFRTEVVSWLKDLAQIDSDQLRILIQEKARALGVTLNVANWAPEPLFPIDELDRFAGDLSSLLRYLGIPKPASSESMWLEDRGVLLGLVDSLVRDLPPEVKVQCAAWLRRSSLTKIVKIDLYTSKLWNSRRLTALEAVAQIASDSDRDIFTRHLDKSLLVKDDFAVRLWKAGKEYEPLVYDLLLALDRRIYFDVQSPRAGEWRITE